MTGLLPLVETARIDPRPIHPLSSADSTLRETFRTYPLAGTYWLGTRSAITAPDLVGGPGFEPGASRSRTVVARVSR